MTLEEDKLMIVMFACSPFANLGIVNEIALAGATLNAFIILDKLMSLVK